MFCCWLITQEMKVVTTFASETKATWAVNTDEPSKDLIKTYISRQRKSEIHEISVFMRLLWCCLWHWGQVLCTFWKDPFLPPTPHPASAGITQKQQKLPCEDNVWECVWLQSRTCCNCFLSNNSLSVHLALLWLCVKLSLIARLLELNALGCCLPRTNYNRQRCCFYVSTRERIRQTRYCVLIWDGRFLKWEQRQTLCSLYQTCNNIHCINLFT